MKFIFLASHRASSSSSVFPSGVELSIFQTTILTYVLCLANYLHYFILLPSLSHLFLHQPPHPSFYLSISAPHHPFLSTFPSLMYLIHLLPNPWPICPSFGFWILVLQNFGDSSMVTPRWIRRGALVSLGSPPIHPYS